MKFFENWKKRRAEARYTRGYEFAMDYIRSRPAEYEEYLTGMVECSRHFNEYDEFDKGVEAALAVAKDRSAAIKRRISSFMGLHATYTLPSR